MARCPIAEHGDCRLRLAAFGHLTEDSRFREYDSTLGRGAFAPPERFSGDEEAQSGTGRVSWNLQMVQARHTDARNEATLGPITPARNVQERPLGV
jgi:hypothetical protein